VNSIEDNAQFIFCVEKSFYSGKNTPSTRPFILIELHSLTLMKVLNRCHVFNQENSFIKVLGNLARFFSHWTKKFN